MFFSSVGFLCIIYFFCWLGMWFTAQLWLHQPPILIKKPLLCLKYILIYWLFPRPHVITDFFLTHFFGHFAKQEGTSYHIVLRVSGLWIADANLVPRSEAVHSQEELDTVEVLALQIPHPLQRIILSLKKVSVGFVGSAASWNCKWGRHNTHWRVSMPSWGMVKMFFWCQGQAEFAHPWVLPFGSKPENLLWLLTCSKSVPCNGDTY